MNWKKTRKILKIIWVVFGISFLAWMFLSMNAFGFDETIFESTPSIQVEKNDNYISFTPTTSYNQVVIFYPGALVDPDAYAPLCRNIAKHGYQTIIIHMPWRMATKGYNKIKEMNILDDSSKKYILAGHSQGAKMAAQFVYENPGVIDHLILLGTTHPRDIDLSSTETKILKIYGSNDGVASIGKIIANKPKLPTETTFVEIDGANHSQFGYYGFQLGDSRASITREEQQARVLDEIVSFLKSE